jgi:hypothetical protein
MIVRSFRKFQFCLLIPIPEDAAVDGRRSFHENAVLAEDSGVETLRKSFLKE